MINMEWWEGGHGLDYSDKLNTTHLTWHRNLDQLMDTSCALRWSHAKKERSISQTPTSEIKIKGHGSIWNTRKKPSHRHCTSGKQEGKKDRAQEKSKLCVIYHPHRQYFVRSSLSSMWDGSFCTSDRLLLFSPWITRSPADTHKHAQTSRSGEKTERRFGTNRGARTCFRQPMPFFSPTEYWLDTHNPLITCSGPTRL